MDYQKSRSECPAWCLAAEPGFITIGLIRSLALYWRRYRRRACQVSFAARDEEPVRLVQREAPLEVEVGAIYDLEGTRPGPCNLPSKVWIGVSEDRGHIGYYLPTGHRPRNLYTLDHSSLERATCTTTASARSATLLKLCVSSRAETPGHLA